ncbi:MAG TPA: aminotransferase [Clostridiales bacterium]|nr:aminotransferase [Clostridiales bacterium]
MKESTTVYYRTGDAGRLPLYATAGSAGCDLFAAVPLALRPGECRILPLDLVIALEPGVEAQIRPRSGLSLRTGLRLPNAPGTIDSDYRCDVGVLLQNTNSISRLPEQIAASPELIRELTACRRVSLAAYLQQADPCPDGSTAADWPALAANLPELAEFMIYLDSRGNPWGTIYIEPGDRIAQMVFVRYLQADFQPHPAPETVGRDRGGGFGSTG